MEIRTQFKTKYRTTLKNVVNTCNYGIFQQYEDKNLPL